MFLYPARRQLFNQLLLIMIFSLFITSCQEVTTYKVVPGVSKQLNDFRKATIEDISYQVHFDIPAVKSEPIDARLKISFKLLDDSKPLTLDFKESEDKVKVVVVAGEPIDYRFENGHIIIPKQHLSEGFNEVIIEFIAGDQSLNRNEEYLYTLFVPDRASTAFPCFDQPNLKATFKLSLTIPAGWAVVANGKPEKKEVRGEKEFYSFLATRPISTYLFAFAAGKFLEEQRTENGRTLTFYHRETKRKKIRKNMDEIFDLHFEAIQWMESYTGIPLPFQKFDFVALPSFQYGGMEHPGSVLYRAEKLFLDQTATQEDKLDRATLIAHETAHMWFGDLVTMAWFDDVWLKEVFANFMAAKIVNPAFPDIDHDQAFLIDHYPKAYAIDRTQGANPIKQDLENMNMAGTLYGSIIYHKAPIVMQQLENIIGEEALTQGLRRYLATYSYDNADWDDLIGILDILTDDDLASWSEVWVKEPGMPSYEVTYEEGKRLLTQSDPMGQSRLWPQMLHPVFIVGEEAIDHTIKVQALETEIPISLEADRFFVNGNGEGYGYFRYSERDLEYLTTESLYGYSAKFRASVYMSVWENMLRNNFDLISMADALMMYLTKEEDELNINLLAGYYKIFFWKYADKPVRQSLVKRLEPELWKKINAETNSSLQAVYFKAYQATALSEIGISNLYKLWNGELEIPGLQLSADDLTTLAFELAVRSDLEDVGFEVDQVLESQLGSIENPDKQKRMAFIIPALSKDEDTRDAFFETLKDPQNREHEPWVQTALRYLHHPLRAAQSVKYVQPSLQMLPEIQETGDIFFPMGWLEATLSGHQSAKAAGIVKIYLNNHPELDPKLNQKVLQAADPLFRASKMTSK